MPTAFGTFDEPHAWLIRGLVEYGWPDISRAGGYVPPGVFGGMDLSRMPEAEGREGVVLEIPASVNGQRFDDDGTYHFQAQVVRSHESGQLAIAVRCPEANFIQEFAYDPSNPTWAAGFIHQALSQYVPQFVQWRQQGGEVTWVQRQSIVELDGEPCSGPLCGFVAESIRAGRSLDRGPAEGWWMGARSPLSVAGGSVSPGGAPVPQVLRQGGAPPVAAGGGWPAAAPAAAMSSGHGRSPVAAGPIVPGIIAGGPIASSGTGLGGTSGWPCRPSCSEKPGTALMVVSGLGFFQGLFWFLNALSVLLFYRQETGALLLSVILALLLVPTGAVAGYGELPLPRRGKTPLGMGGHRLRRRGAVCCLGGVPIAAWAIKTWMDPVFKQRR